MSLELEDWSGTVPEPKSQVSVRIRSGKIVVRPPEYIDFNSLTILDQLPERFQTEQQYTFVRVARSYLSETNGFWDIFQETDVIIACISIEEVQESSCL